MAKQRHDAGVKKRRARLAAAGALPCHKCGAHPRTNGPPGARHLKVNHRYYCTERWATR